jgi:hypothetical protein
MVRKRLGGDEALDASWDAGRRGPLQVALKQKLPATSTGG